jgi:hypothetical protein
MFCIFKHFVPFEVFSPFQSTDVSMKVGKELPQNVFEYVAIIKCHNLVSFWDRELWP